MTKVTSIIVVVREIALQEASSAPLLSKPKRNVQPSQVYPYVFDALAERQRSTAFISDTKVPLSFLALVHG